MNGKAVAGAGVGALPAGVAVAAGAGAGAAAAAALPVPGSNVGVEVVLGGSSVTMTADFSPGLPLMTKIAGCALVAPPTGISATAMWRPGATLTGADEADAVVTPSSGRATVAGAETSCPTLSSVPWSVARTGWYCPDGHQAQAIRPTSAAVAATTAARRAGWSALQPRALVAYVRTSRCAIRTVPSTGSASAKSRTIEASNGRIWPPPAWSGIDETMCEPLPYVEAASLGSSRIAVSDMLISTGTITRTQAVTRTRARPVSADGWLRSHGSSRRRVGPMCV